MFKKQNVLWLCLCVFACKKAFVPAGVVASTNKYLVIDGTINTGSTDSTFFKLSTTKKFDTVITVDPVSLATVTIESDAAASINLPEISPGTYGAPPLNLSIANKYRLRVKTADNREYLSDYVTVKNSPPIDSIGFRALADGVHIYVSSHDNANATKYYRWDYNEDWQFHSNVFSNYAGDKYYCFNRDVSGDINIANSVKLSSDVIYQAPIAVVPASSEKLEIKYSILIRQYALTSDAYSFWENLQKNNEKVGTIFDPQPALNQTNYHNTANPNELVIGYLSAGSFASRRIFISRSQLPSAYKVSNGFNCKIDSSFYFHAPYYYPHPPDASVDLSGQYPGLIGVEASTDPPYGPFNAPHLITYTRTECAVCTIRGTQVTPPFWK